LNLIGVDTDTAKPKVKIPKQIKEINKLIEKKRYDSAIELTNSYISEALSDEKKDLLEILLGILNNICDKSDHTVISSLERINHLLDHSEYWIRQESLQILKKLYLIQPHNFDELIDFHNNHDGIITMTTVQPQSRYGTIDFGKDGRRVKSFEEKPVGERGWINGGFFVCDPEVFDYIKDDTKSIFERDPLETISLENKLYAYKHNGFWRAMDSLKDKNDIEEMWNNNKATWKVWNI